MPQGWLDVVARELGIDGDVDAVSLLETARDVAHNVERKATPLTTYLIGVAVGRSSGGEDVSALCERVSRLARGWEADAHGRRS